jgi:4'-phosphopantetheinyl transferase
VIAAPLRAGEIVLIDGRLDLSPGRRERLAAALSGAERARAARAASPEARRRAVVARGLLRAVLGQATGRAPTAVDLRREPGGRPVLAGGELWFSVAHCGERILIALAADRPVGVDIERHRAVTGAADVARRVLGPAEAAALAALPEPARSAALVAAWTRLEARFKAGPSALPAVELDVGPGWSAAVAAKGSGWRVVRSAAPA